MNTAKNHIHLEFQKGETTGSATGPGNLAENGIIPPKPRKQPGRKTMTIASTYCRDIFENPLHGFIS
jgi:hypothetical protein